VSNLVLYVCPVCDVASEKFAKKLLGKSEIEDVLHRMDRLTVDEARMTGTETLQVVHGLESNVKLVTGGTHRIICFLPITNGLF
jgi:hypothetical protein